MANSLGTRGSATGFEKIICMSSIYQVAMSEWEPERYLCVYSSEFRNVSSGESVLIRPNDSLLSIVLYRMWSLVRDFSEHGLIFAR